MHPQFTTSKVYRITQAKQLDTFSMLNLTSLCQIMISMSMDKLEEISGIGVQTKLLFPHSENAGPCLMNMFQAFSNFCDGRNSITEWL